MMNLRAAVVAVLALTLATAAAGCGGAPETPPPAPSSAATPSAESRVETALPSTASAGPSVTPALAASPAVTPAATSTVVLPDAQTGIAGLVLIGPQCPVVREGEDCPDKPFAATIEIYSGARLVATAGSGPDGIFVAELDPGTYRLVPLPPGGPVFAREEIVDVRAGGTTRIIISYDSGIR